MKINRKYKKQLYSFFVALLLIFVSNVANPIVKVHAQPITPKENSSDLDLTGGIITAISNSRFLSNIAIQTLYVGDAIDMLSGTISAIEEQNITIEKDGSSYTQTIAVDWNEEVFDTSVTGSFNLIATIVAPEGVTFAPGVLTQITIPITVIEKPEIIEITSLIEYGNLTSTVLIPVNDADIWEQTLQTWYDYYSFVWGVSDNDEGVEVILTNLDSSQVDYTTPGDYSVVLTYQIDAYLQDYYVLADYLQTITIPVKVSDPSEFELVIKQYNDAVFTGSYLYEPEDELSFYYIATDKAIEVDELNALSCETVNESMGFISGKIFRIFRSELTENTHYYFFSKDGENYSNYVHIFNSNTLPTFDYISGDRDGGDSSNRPLPDYDPNLDPKPDSDSDLNPGNTPEPLPTNPEPEITKNPTQLIAQPENTPDIADTTISATKKPNSVSQPDAPLEPETPSQPVTSKNTQPTTKPTTTTTSSVTDTLNTSDSNKTDEQKDISWMPLFIIIVILIIAIVIGVTISAKRRKHG